MAQLNVQEAGAVHMPKERERAVKIVSKSIFRELKGAGYDSRMIVALATELISLVTTEMKESDQR